MFVLSIYLSTDTKDAMNLLPPGWTSAHDVSLLTVSGFNGIGAESSTGNKYSIAEHGMDLFI